MNETTQKKRVYALYRVSTKGQVEKNDIPMQKLRCHEFARQQGWEIFHEESELGVSGFKISAKDRDAVQSLQRDALLGKFDILLVFMFDRLGRREDETPFVVEWFVRNGIEVWSAEEGQQRFDNHVDKLLNYIRYWQASGESIKTSIRSKTRMGQLTEAGYYMGGNVPYGYYLEHKGRFNIRNREVYEIAIDETEAAVVRMVFEKYVYEGYGGQRVSQYLRTQGIRTRKGKEFVNTTILNMIRNVTYTGVLQHGEARSEIIPELQIIEPALFERAQKIMGERVKPHREVPFNTVGKALLSGLAYCGHCGSKLASTTSGYRESSGGLKTRRRYACHNKVRHPDLCDGQSGYGAKTLEETTLHTLTALFQLIRSTASEDVIQAQYEKRLRTCKIALEQAMEQYRIKGMELQFYKNEIGNVISGTSSFSMELLNELIIEVKEQMETALNKIELAKVKVSGYDELAKLITARYAQAAVWAESFDACTLEAKKMILFQLFERIEVQRDHQITLHLTEDYKMIDGLAEEAQNPGGGLYKIDKLAGGIARLGSPQAYVLCPQSMGETSDFHSIPVVSIPCGA